MREIRIGTRGSRLALIQVDLLEAALKEKYPDIKIKRVIIHTVADKDQNTPLVDFKEQGVFAKELERALLNNEIDIAVQSAKDMSVRIPEGLVIAGTLKRADVRDVLVYRKEFGVSLNDINKTLKIGTDSPRRVSQLENLYPLFSCESIRGNVPTRLDKVRNGEYDGALLAVAGLERLGLLEDEDFYYHFFKEEEILPAGGQAIIALETRTDDYVALIVRAISDDTAYAELKVEQQILKNLNAGCHEPIAVRAKVTGDDVTIFMAVANIMDGGKKSVIRRNSIRGKLVDWERLAEEVSKDF